MSDGRRARAAAWSVLLAACGLWLLACWPVLSGGRTFYFRDIFLINLPLKAYGAMALAHGQVPALDTSLGLGQFYRGDGGALAYYPSNLLYLVLPFWIAFNLHLCLHWLLAGVTMALLAREMGRSREAAVLAALAYGGGGCILSALSFYNAIVVLAWWPLMLWGALRGGRRGITVGALALGLDLLGGDPLLTAVAAVAVGWMAVQRWGLRRGLAITAVIGLGGALVALPQLVATLRVLPFSTRGRAGVSAGEAIYYRFHPLRLLDLLLPLPWAEPQRWGEEAWSARLLPELPYFYALYPGIVATLLAALAAWRQRGLAAMAVVGVLLGWAPGLSGALISRSSFGLFRYPEKWLIFLALAVPLLAAAGFDEVRAGKVAGWRAAAIGGGLLLGAALVVRSGIVLRDPAGVARLGRALLLAGLLLGLAAWVLWRRLPLALLVLELLALVPLQPLLMTDSLEHYRPSPWLQLLGERRAVLPLQRQAAEDITALRRRRAFELSPAPGVLHGLVYPLAPDINGLQYPNGQFLLRRLTQDGWPLAWLRTVGVEAVVAAWPLPGLRVVAAHRTDFGPAFLQLVDGAAPAAWWPARLEVARSAQLAYEMVARHADATSEAVVPVALPHAPGGSVRILRDSADRIELETQGGGGVVVVRRAFQPLWRARAGARPLTVLPADLVLTGILVPPGRQRVELAVDGRPEGFGAAIALLITLALIVVASLPVRSHASP